MKHNTVLIILSVVLTISLSTAVFTGCITSPKLVQNRDASAYLSCKYGEVIYSGLNFYISSGELERDMKVFRESVSADRNLGDKAKQTLLKEAGKYSFVEKGYLIYKFKIWNPAGSDLDKYKFEFNDLSGNTMIQGILPVVEKIRATGRSGNGMMIDQTYYSYIWIIKLKKPFTPDDLPTGTYKASIIYPDNSSAVYEIENK